ncbi:MAG: PAS domain S-box protein [Leptolyngbyaceae cyanobacterium SU_3_3]|nr:PAS domain S-box protein [Leptolyngbyaceae cyanobacterium SU_3_3]
MADDSPISIDFSLSPVLDEAGNVIMLVPEGRDISDLKAAERKIREQAMLLNVATDAILVQDLEHQVQFWNTGAERIYGWQAEEMIGQNASILMAPKVSFHTASHTVLQQGEWQGEIRKLTKAGKEVLV